MDSGIQQAWKVLTSSAKRELRGLSVFSQEVVVFMGFHSFIKKKKVHHTDSRNLLPYVPKSTRSFLVPEFLLVTLS